MPLANLQETPCFVVFDFLKREASVNYKDFATVLFNKNAKLGKVPLINRLEDKTFMSRQVVRLRPGEMSKNMFDDFSLSSTFAWNELKRVAGDEFTSSDERTKLAYKKLVDVGVPQMNEVLKTYRLKDKAFMNVVIAVANMQQLSLGSKGSLIMLLFVATGCTGDVSYAVDLTIEEMNMQGAVMKTAQFNEDDYTTESLKEEDFDAGLTLFRIKNSVMVTPGHTLYPGEGGTEIGLLPHGNHTIADVEKTVSRSHLQIYKSEDGRWLARGLNSKNGTYKISAGTHEKIVIEQPRGKNSEAQNKEVEIMAGDHLVLGHDTEFIVCKTIIEGN